MDECKCEGRSDKKELHKDKIYLNSVAHTLIYTFLGTTCIVICLTCSNLQQHNSVLKWMSLNDRQSENLSDEEN